MELQKIQRLIETKNKTYKSEVYVRCRDIDAKGGDGEYIDTIKVKCAFFDDDGDLILDIDLN